MYSAVNTPFCWGYRLRVSFPPPPPQGDLHKHTRVPSPEHRHTHTIVCVCVCVQKPQLENGSHFQEPLFLFVCVTIHLPTLHSLPLAVSSLSSSSQEMAFSSKCFLLLKSHIFNSLNLRGPENLQCAHGHQNFV